MAQQQQPQQQQPQQPQLPNMANIRAALDGTTITNSFQSYHAHQQTLNTVA
jgi:hypothetical protein